MGIRSSVRKTAVKVSPPDYVGKIHDCSVCGGQFKVLKSTYVEVTNSGDTTLISAVCPHCLSVVPLNFDLHAAFKAKLVKFVLSQVAPIKAIEDEKIRLPMQKLLDDFYSLLQERK